MDCILCKNASLDRKCVISVTDLASIYSSWLEYDISLEFKELTSIDFLECPKCGLSFFSPLVTGSWKFYEALSKSMGSSYYQDDKNEYQFAGGFINRNDSVLDVGSGRGLFSAYVSGTYTGLDFNPSAISQAAFDGITVINESLENHINNISSPYSVVTAFQVLEHMSDPRGFIQMCVNALRPGGLLIISVPSEDSFVALQENAVLNMPPHHVSRWTDRSLLSIRDLFGLTLVALEHEKLSSIHFEPYVQSLANMIIRTLFPFGKVGLVDISMKKRIVDRLSIYIKPLLKKVFANEAIWPNGHSVTAVYRK